MARTYPPASMTKQHTEKLLALVTNDLDSNRATMSIADLQAAMELYNIVQTMDEKAGRVGVEEEETPIEKPKDKKKKEAAQPQA